MVAEFSLAWASDAPHDSVLSSIEGRLEILADTCPHVIRAYEVFASSDGGNHLFAFWITTHSDTVGQDEYAWEELPLGELLDLLDRLINLNRITHVS